MFTPSSSISTYEPNTFPGSFQSLAVSWSSSSTQASCSTSRIFLSKFQNLIFFCKPSFPLTSWWRWNQISWLVLYPCFLSVFKALSQNALWGHNCSMIIIQKLLNICSNSFFGGLLTLFPIWNVSLSATTTFAFNAVVKVLIAFTFCSKRWICNFEFFCFRIKFPLTTQAFILHFYNVCRIC